MLSKLFNKYKTYIYLVSIAGLIFILTAEQNIIEGAKNRKNKKNRKNMMNKECDQEKCKTNCPDNDLECLQKYVECENCKFSVSQLKNMKSNNTLNMYKINNTNTVYEKHEGDVEDTNIGSIIPKLGIIPAQGESVLDPNKDIMFRNDKLNRSYMFFPVRKSTTGMFQETGPQASNI